MTNSSKYIIRNAWVVSVDKTIGTVPDCDVVIEDGEIVAVGPNLKYSTDHDVIDGTNAIVCPGFIDTHRHAWQTQFRALGADFVLSDYILTARNIYGSCYTAHDAYVGTLCGALESIDNGITYIIDHSHIMNTPDHADAVVKAHRDAGIRSTLCYAMYPNPAWEGSTLDSVHERESPFWRLEDAKRVARQYFSTTKATDLTRFGLATSEPDLSPHEQLVGDIKAAREFGAAVITSHTSYGKWDPGNFVVRQLGEEGLLGPDMLFSHGNTFADDELNYIQKHGCGIGVTPDTELQMGMSFPVAFRARDKGCAVGLGVDVCCSTAADMFHQMHLMLQSQRHLEHESKSGPPLSMYRRCADVLEMATLGGAKAVGLESIIGSISPGKRADLLLIRCDSTRLVPVHDPVGAIVQYANASDIDTVFIGGNIVKENGKLTVVDWTEVREELRASTRRIRERAKLVPAGEVEKNRDVMVRYLKEAMANKM